MHFLLVLANVAKSFEIECESSGKVISVVLMQEETLNAYFSKTLSGVALNYFM